MIGKRPEPLVEQDAWRSAAVKDGPEARRSAAARSAVLDSRRAVPATLRQEDQGEGCSSLWAVFEPDLPASPPCIWNGLAWAPLVRRGEAYAARRRAWQAEVAEHLAARELPGSPRTQLVLEPLSPEPLLGPAEMAP